MNQFNQRPFLISGKASAIVGPSSYNVFLDINNKSRLEGFYFECDLEDELFPHFNELAIALERVPLSKMSSVVLEWKEGRKKFFSSKIINIPEYLLDLALADYEGKNYSYESLSSNSSDKLICRCFGVSEKQIFDLVKETPSIDLLNIADKLKATIGCGSCKVDVSETLSKAKNIKLIEGDKLRSLDLKFDTEGARVRPMGLTPCEFVLKVDGLKTKWMKEQELDSYQIEILGISGHALSFSVQPSDNGRYILNTFSEYVEDKLGLVLRFDLLI